MTPAAAAPNAPDTALGYMAALTDLCPSALNPRTHFDDLDDLAANIAQRGVLVPLLVRPRRNVSKGNGQHAEWTSLEIVDGERRYRAAKQAGTVTELPVIKRDLTDEEVLEIQLVSAIQRSALTPLEEARGYHRLIDSNRSKYSAAYIGDRIGRSERYVVDRMRLLQLIPALQQLLDAERIGVAHAELLAKHKPEDQERASHPGDRDKYGRAGDPGGLWSHMSKTFDFDEADEAGEAAALAKDPYAGLKPRTVKELEAWLATHVKFDVTHAAATAPLDFGETAIAVETAQAQPGRGKKVIQITEDYRIDDDVKDPSVRVYGGQSWKRADGTAGTSRGGRHGTERVDSPTCEHSVLGVVVVGPGYGSAFQVCVARDRCEVHWAAEIKERAKNAKLRAKAQGTKPAKKTESYEERWKREAAERKAREQAWAALWKLLQPEVVRQAKAVTALTNTQATQLEKSYDIMIDPDLCKRHGLTWWKNLPAALVLSEVVTGAGADDWADFVKRHSALLDLKPLQTIRDQHEAAQRAGAKSKGVPTKTGSAQKATNAAKAKKAGKAAKTR